MLAVANSPNIFQNFDWEFADHGVGIMMETRTGDQPTMESFDDLLDYAMLQDHDIDGGLGESPPLSGSAGSGSGDDHRVVKKRQNHNESERDRRKKINALFSSLRTLLPASDLTKKLSIPSTVGKVLKYIPELEKEVEDLTQKKQEILHQEDQLFKTFQDHHDHDHHQGRPTKRSKITKSSSVSIDLQKMEEREIVVHVSSSQRIKSLPELLLLLEKASFLVIHVSSFQSFGGSTFYTLHLAQMEGTKNIELESLKKKLSAVIEKHN